MTEQDLRNLLLEYEATQRPVHTGERSRSSSGAWFIRILTVVTVLLWLLAATALGLYLIYSVAFMEEFAHGRRIPKDVGFDTMVFAMGVVAAIAVASVSTLVLVFVARAARLRRTNAGLFEILSQLLQHKRSEKDTE